MGSRLVTCQADQGGGGDRNQFSHNGVFIEDFLGFGESGCVCVCVCCTGEINEYIVLIILPNRLDNQCIFK